MPETICAYVRRIPLSSRDQPLVEQVRVLLASKKRILRRSATALISAYFRCPERAGMPQLLFFLCILPNPPVFRAREYP
jgi:hypothetical protein